MLLDWKTENEDFLKNEWKQCVCVCVLAANQIAEHVVFLVEVVIYIEFCNPFLPLLLLLVLFISIDNIFLN